MARDLLAAIIALALCCGSAAAQDCHVAMGRDGKRVMKCTMSDFNQIKGGIQARPEDLTPTEEEPNPDPAAPMSLANARDNFETVVTSYIGQNSSEGYWMFERPGVPARRLSSARVDRDSVREVSPNHYIGRASLTQVDAPGRVIIEFLLDFSVTPWEVERCDLATGSPRTRKKAADRSAREITLRGDEARLPEKAACRISIPDATTMWGRFNRRFSPAFRLMFGKTGDVPRRLGYQAGCPARVPELVSGMQAWSPEMKASPEQSAYNRWAIWDGITGRVVLPQGDTRSYRSAAFSADGRFIATVDYGTPPAHAQPLRLVDGHIHKVEGDPETLRSRLRVLALQSAQETALIELPWIDEGNPVLAISADGHRLAMAGQKHWVQMWDTNTQQRVGKLIDDAAPQTPLALSGDGKIVAYNDADGSLRVREADTGRATHILPSGAAEALAFSADGQLLAAATLGRIRVWRVPSGELRALFEGYGRDLVFDASGRNLFCTGTEGIDVFPLPQVQPAAK